MKRIVIIFTALALISTSFTTIGTYVNDLQNQNVPQSGDIKELKMEITFSNPEVADDGNYATIHLEGCSSLLSPGKPVIPVYKKIMTFPFGTHIKSIEVSANDIEEKSLYKKIMPAYDAVPPDMHSSLPALQEDKTIYEGKEFPQTWYEYAAMGGIKDGKHATILSLNKNKVGYAK
ncbi:hypothetical protein B6U81_02305 [Thermoplasmatales archaeon ex4484_30]|nr:MAG: hypothetical protein B6U81_02305 [Thermoplasmatales archaeon ex4484_30]